MATPSTGLLPLSGNIYVDAMTNGTYWVLDQSRNVTWALSNFGPYEWFNPAETAYAINQAYSSFALYANIKFTYVGIYSSPNTTPADTAISIDGIGSFFSSPNVWALGFFPNIGVAQALVPPTLRDVYRNAPGDIWLNLTSTLNSVASYVPGSEGFAIIAHEIGHTVGLKHPHDGGATGRPTFASIGSSKLDIDWATIMSYNESYPTINTQWHPATPMILDVIALQALYGANLRTNAGNETHRLLANNQYQTIFDPTGTDTLDASGSSYGWAIDLSIDPANEYHPYSIGLAEALDGIAQPTSLYWLYGQIEKVIGSNKADRITGTAQAELIAGGGGNDLIYGAGGNDTFYAVAGQDAIFGGDGFDTFNVGLAASQTIAGKLRDNAFIISDRSGNLSLVRNVEQIVFSDATVNLNAVAPAGNVDSALTQIYVAAFRRAPETSGYKYWLQQETATSINKVADTIFSLDIVKSLYPTAMTNAQFVSAIYQNVFNRTPDTEGLNYWVGQLNSATRGKLVLDMTNAALNVPDGSAGKDYFQNRLDWSIYSVVYQSNHQEMTPSHLASLTNRITDDPFTVLTLIGQAEAGMAI